MTRLGGQAKPEPKLPPQLGYALTQATRWALGRWLSLNVSAAEGPRALGAGRLLLLL